MNKHHSNPVPVRARRSKTLSEALCCWDVWNPVIFGWFPVLNYQIATILAPAIGQRYFLDQYPDWSDNHADSYFAYWVGIFSTLSGICGFLGQSYIGQLSDIYGRKPLLFFILLFTQASGIILTFTDNVWYVNILFFFFFCNMIDIFVIPITYLLIILQLYYCILCLFCFLF